MPWQLTTIIKDDIISEIAAIKKQDGGDILVQGSGKLVNCLLKAGLVDELKLLIHPHIIGTGQRLFAEGLDVPLAQKSILQLDNGVTYVSYTPHVQIQ